MDRLLGPNETKFWLLDLTAPMNLVVVVRLGSRPAIEMLAESGAFSLPLSAPGQYGRPRWGASSSEGVVEVFRASHHDDWLAQAQRLLLVRVGKVGHPPYHAVLLEHARGATLLLTLSHALFDYRSALCATEAFLAGREPGPLMPACEELLPADAYRLEDADELIDFWWRREAGIRWEAAGLERLASVLPSSAATQLASRRLTQEQGEGLQRRFADEGVSLANAVAVATSRASGEKALTHAIDMTRYIEPRPSGPGLAISHLHAEVTDGSFWDQARAVRRQLRDGIESGRAGDNLLALPRVLRQASLDGIARSAPASITSAPRAMRSTLAPDEARWVVSSARGGGFVVNPLKDDQGIALLLCSASNDSRALHDDICEQLLHAAGLGQTLAAS